MPLIALLVASAAAYALAVRRVPGRAPGARRVAAFAAGWAALAAALLPPLERLAAASLSAHMVQHLLLASLAAPLLAYGVPLGLLTGALGLRARRLVHRGRRAVGAVPVAAALVLHAGALWAWHVPALYERALRDGLLHGLEHWSFLATGLLFWWAVLGTGRAADPSGARILCLLLLAVQGSALGALLAFSGSPWYAPYALPDQQLAGLLMWGFGALVPAAAAVALVVAWLERDGYEATSSRSASATSRPSW